MNKLELLEKRNGLIKTMKSILNNCKQQKRELLKVEDNEFRSIQKQINEIDNTINNNNQKTKQITNMNSLFRNLINASKGEEIDGQNEIKNEIRKSGKEVADNSFVLNVRAVAPTGGETLTPTNVMEVAAILAEQSLIAKVGGHIVAVPADIVLPSLNKGTLSWEDEGADVTNNNFTITSKKLTLQRLSGAFPLDKKMSKVVSPSLESAITDSIYKIVDEKINEKLLTNVATTVNVISAGTTNYDRLVEAEGMLLGKNINAENCVYIYNPADLSKLKASGKKANEITEAILKDGMISGYNAFASSFVAKGTVLMLDATALWANIAFVELQYDPYTLSAKGQDRIVINAYADTAIANADFAVKVTLV